MVLSLFLGQRRHKIFCIFHIKGNDRKFDGKNIVEEKERENHYDKEIVFIEQKSYYYLICFHHIPHV